MLIGRFSPEEQAARRAEIGRRLAVVAGLSEVSPIGGLPERFIVRTAKARVTIRSNDNEDRAEIGRKLAMVAGIL